MNIVMVNNSPIHSHVRLLKYIKYFHSNGFKIQFISWLRDKSEDTSCYKEKFLLIGGGYSNRKLVIYYIIWIIRLFLYFISKKDIKNMVVFVVNFDCALAVFMASLFRKKIIYVYDIHDDFALSYKFPPFFVSLISCLDRVIKLRAKKTIHVDESRVRINDKNYEIIYNSPEDYYKGNYVNTKIEKSKQFVVSGLLSKDRGLESICQFALANPQYGFIVAGRPVDDIAAKMTKLSNVNYLGYVEQQELFRVIRNADGIFSLYDPNKEINKLAASNKLYDAMMLGIPVIVNKEIISARFVEANGIGFVVSYEYNETWHRLKMAETEDLNRLGLNGRKLFEDKYTYDLNFTAKLDRIFRDMNLKSHI